VSRVCTTALDYAADLIAARLGVGAVLREPLGADEPEAEPGADVALVAALTEGNSTELGYLLSAATPYEFEHAATFDLIVVGGGHDERRARRDDALFEAQAAIAADPTLGGLVDWAELENPDFSAEDRHVGVTATLTLTYTAPTALG
jgi:hypothetical protein